MKNVFISKAQAIQLVGAEEVRRIVEQRDTSLLSPSGCKLSARKRGCVTRFMVGGYAHDGSDTNSVLAQLGLQA